MSTIARTDRKTPAGQNNGERRYISPPVDIVETKDGFYLEAEMPGVNKSGLEVLLEQNELTLVGHRSQEASNDAEFLYRESDTRDFRRVFALDPTIDTAKIDAKIENGVLRLFLPKAEAVKPRKIVISE